MIQKIQITTRANLMEKRKQEYRQAGYRIENESSAANGMCSFTAIRIVEEEPASEFG